MYSYTCGKQKGKGVSIELKVVAERAVEKKRRIQERVEASEAQFEDGRKQIEEMMEEVVRKRRTTRKSETIGGRVMEGGMLIRRGEERMNTGGGGGRKS